MLTDIEILAGSVTRLKPEAQLALSNLVRRSTAFRVGRASYRTNVLTRVKAVATAAKAAEVIAASEAAPEPFTVAEADAASIAAGATPEDLALAKSLAAVCEKLAGLPGIAVESEGSDKNRRFFSSTVNWEELALDIINVLYSDPPAMGQLFAVVTRKVCDNNGLVWASLDELRFTARSRLTVPPYLR